jgi:hypothetical protein
MAIIKASDQKNPEGGSMARSRRVRAAATVLIVPLLPFIPASTAVAAPPTAPAPVSDVRELTRKDFTLDGKKLEQPERFQPKANAGRVGAAAETPPVGTVRQWLGLDDFLGQIYRKDYTLRGVGNKIEVWVANDRAFPEADCRKQIPGSTDVTDAQVADLINEFDTNMFPKETAAFSTPPDRDGSNAILGPDPNGNGGVYTGGGDKTVTLIDNVRDDNFYNFPARPTQIGGFFSAQFNELFDRNVMTIDAYDWAHRTGANPPDEPTNDLCTSRPARPRLYEGTFAHEWQHLAHYYTDPFEGNWINEGLSDWAQTLVGYVDGRTTVFDRGADSHLYCYQGYGIVQTPFNTNPRDCGGPENSLTLWGDGDNPNAVLADYGHAYSFMLFLADRYGADIMTRLHNDAAKQGLASLKEALAAEGVTDMYKVLHDHQSMVLLDKIVGDSRRGIVLGIEKSRVTTPSLRSTLNLANTTINRRPGAAPNGADYVSLGAGRNLRSLSFEGAKSLPPLPLEWTTVTNDPDRPGNSVLWSGNGNNLNSAAIRSVAVPTADPTLRLLAKYGAEQGYDYGYVVVSTDGGATYTPIAGDKTVAGPLGPALNGTTQGFEPHTFNLSAYAGQTVLLGFRYVSDGGVNEGGLLIDDASIGATPVTDGANLDAFDSPTEIKPIDVHNWNVKLIGFDEKHSFALHVEANGKSSVSLSRQQLALFSLFPNVVAVVAYDEPTEEVQQYAPYKLTANGVVQPGG